MLVKLEHLPWKYIKAALAECPVHLPFTLTILYPIPLLKKQKKTNTTDVHISLSKPLSSPCTQGE